MAKLPYMQFYPSDYQADVRCLPMATQGAWMQILCVLWRSAKRGQKTLTIEEWSRELGCPSCDVTIYVSDLERHKVGKISRETIENVELVTIKSLRIVREKMKQSLALKRKQKQRDMQMSRGSHAAVTPLSQQSHAEESEIRIRNQSHISESDSEEEKKEERKKKITGQVKTVPGIPKSSETWKAYSQEYKSRYGVDPVRNKTVNAQLCIVVDKLGADIAPQVAAFYLTHNGNWYVQNMHPVNLLVRDAEKLHTEWSTGRQMTNSQARQVDKTAGRLNVFNEFLAEKEAEAHEQSSRGNADSRLRINGDGVIEAHAKVVG